MKIPKYIVDDMQKMVKLSRSINEIKAEIRHFAKKKGMSKSDLEALDEDLIMLSTGEDITDDIIAWVEKEYTEEESKLEQISTTA